MFQQTTPPIIDFSQLLNQTTFDGQLTLPSNSFPSQTLGLNNQNINGSLEEIILPQAILPTPDFGLGLGGFGSLFSEYNNSVRDFFKNVYIAIFALILIGFGLYLMAKSTDTGSAILNVAKKI